MQWCQCDCGQVSMSWCWPWLECSKKSCFHCFWIVPCSDWMSGCGTLAFCVVQGTGLSACVRAQAQLAACLVDGSSVGASFVLIVVEIGVQHSIFSCEHFIWLFLEHTQAGTFCRRVGWWQALSPGAAGQHWLWSCNWWLQARLCCRACWLSGWWLQRGS